MAVRIHDRENAGVFFLLRFAWLFVPRNAAGAQFGLLHIKTVFHVSAAGTVENEARARDCGEHGSAKQSAQAARIMQGEIEGVIGDRILALDADVAADRFGKAEKQQRMIDQVWREVEENASAGANALAPCTRL